jgi:hypothetical protein
VTSPARPRPSVRRSEGSSAGHPPESSGLRLSIRPLPGITDSAASTAAHFARDRLTDPARCLVVEEAVTRRE